MVRRACTPPNDSGATAVEFALVAPLLVTLLFGIFEFGRLMAAQTAVVTASREAARFGSALGTTPLGLPQYADCDAIRDAARDRIVMAQLEDTDIVVSYLKGSAASPTTAADCDASTATPDPTAIAMTDGTRVVVDVSFTFTGVVPFLPTSMQSVALSSTDSRSIFTGVAP